jgi:hypothetical protein
MYNTAPHAFLQKIVSIIIVSKSINSEILTSNPSIHQRTRDPIGGGQPSINFSCVHFHVEFSYIVHIQTNKARAGQRQLTAQALRLRMADSSISGWLFKLGEKGLIKAWKKRFCVLESGRVYYYTSSSPEQRATTCKGFIELKTGSSGIPNTPQKTVLCVSQLRILQCRPPADSMVSTPKIFWDLSILYQIQGIL